MAKTTKKKKLPRKTGAKKIKKEDKPATKRTQKSVKAFREPIVIDAQEGLVFKTEEELYEHFREFIKVLEEEMFEARSEKDISVDEFPDYEECLPMLLEEPFEIWKPEREANVLNYIGEFEDEDDAAAAPIFYIAQVYVTDEKPSFVYLHFPSKEVKMMERYRQGELVYDQSQAGLPLGAAQGDSLSEGEDLAVGLYEAMLKLRGDMDILEEHFHEFVELREECIEEADEIWQSTDLQGNVLVTFVKEFSEIEVHDYPEQDLYYLAVTCEEPSSQTHTLLFSFPTVDRHLVDRYRHGENLQAEEVVQQNNH